MIPRILHACWFGGRPMPSVAEEYLNSWRRYNPDYEIKIWSEESFDINENAYVKEAYESKKFAFVTDYVRLKALYEYGGIYMDTDVEVVKPLDDLLVYPAFSGFEAPRRIPTGTMGAEPGNPWIGLLLADYRQRHFIREDGSLDLTTNVETITRLTVENYPIRLDNSLQEFSDFVMLPFDYLCAKNIDNGKVEITENTYTVHHFSGSWLTPRKKFVKFLQNTLGYGFVDRLVKIKHKLFGRDK